VGERVAKGVQRVCDSVMQWLVNAVRVATKTIEDEKLLLEWRVAK